jgi:hypothetical protein
VYRNLLFKTTSAPFLHLVVSRSVPLEKHYTALCCLQASRSESGRVAYIESLQRVAIDLTLSINAITTSNTRNYAQRSVLDS